jgi:hypothetical protein
MMVNAAIASPPARPPWDYVTCSNHLRYCAYLSVKEGIKVFRVGSAPYMGLKSSNVTNVLDGNREHIFEPSYTLSGWYSPETFISDDGQKFVAIQDMIYEPLMDKLFALKLWVGGNLVKTLYIKDVLSMRKVQRVEDGRELRWVEKAGFDDSGRFLLKLVDGTTYTLKF